MNESYTTWNSLTFHPIARAGRKNAMWCNILTHVAKYFRIPISRHYTKTTPTRIVTEECVWQCTIFELWKIWVQDCVKASLWYGYIHKRIILMHLKPEAHHSQMGKITCLKVQQFNINHCM